ncbi:hypothetical protein V1514DRAFT_349558 [Lipomyces japonicus]|uniref:uncharacterized protein n=1 Tax=Lipomyces japonicus TaxID=56871 RepID=UPI0034CF8173
MTILAAQVPCSRDGPSQLGITKRRTMSAQIRQPQSQSLSNNCSHYNVTCRSVTSPARLWYDGAGSKSGRKRVRFAQFERVHEYDREPIGSIAVVAGDIPREGLRARMHGVVCRIKLHILTKIATKRNSRITNKDYYFDELKGLAAFAARPDKSLLFRNGLKNAKRIIFGFFEAMQCL